MQKQYVVTDGTNYYTTFSLGVFTKDARLAVRMTKDRAAAVCRTWRSQYRSLKVKETQ